MINIRVHLSWVTTCLLLAYPAIGQAQARTQAGTPAPQSTPAPQGETSAYDRIWHRFTTIYDDRSNSVVQRVVLSGRFQHEFAALNADQGNHDEWNTRRFRIGPRLTLWRTWTVSAEAELNPQEANPLYMRLTDVYVQWSRGPRLAVTVGKHGMPFTLDGATSSKELLTIDRSNLANNIWFPEEYLPGVSLAGRVAPWTYRVGVYSAGERTKEFGRFNGGTATLAALGYDFAKRLGVREALLSGNYVYQNADRNNTFTRPLEHVVSITFRLERDPWGFRGDVSAAAGYLGQSDLRAVMATPYVNVTDKLQVVGRYTFVESDTPNGVRLGTYESRIVAGRGDEYHEGYIGANYFFYGHKLKLQTGLQYADMDDRANDGGAYSGLSWIAGIRIGWP
jgi:phosphate-selective porin OprO/OprP